VDADPHYNEIVAQRWRINVIKFRDSPSGDSGGHLESQSASTKDLFEAVLVLSSKAQETATEAPHNNLASKGQQTCLYNDA
jgi:hypothetical protein